MGTSKDSLKGVQGFICIALALAACVLALAVALPARALAADPVCTVNGVQYDDLGTAIDEAPDGADVVLLSNASVDGVKRIGKSLSIDLGGNELTCGTLSQSSVSCTLTITNGTVYGLVSAKNLTLDGVNVSATTQNGGVVSASLSSSIANSTITNGYDVIDGRTSAALSVGGSGDHKVSNSSFSGKSAVYFSNPSGAVRFDACNLTGLVSGSAAINMYASDAIDVLIENCIITAHASGKAFSGSWNMAGVVELGQGNVVSGTVQVSGRDTSSNVYELRVSGGTFSNGGQMPFVPQAPEFEAQMLERLNVIGGSFDADVSSVLRSGYECVQNPDGMWSVYDDVTASGYYTLADDGSKVKHDSIASAIADGTGTVYVSRDAVLSAEEAKALSAASRALASAPGVTVSFDGTAAQLCAVLSGAEDLNVAVKSGSGEATLRGLVLEGGRMVACSAGITESNASELESLLAEGHVFDASSSDYRIIATPGQGALIGSLWYPDLDRAITAASVDDATAPVSETITMLSDAEGPVDVVYPMAAFTIDFAGHSIDGGSGNGLVIAPVSYGGSLSSSPDGCNITLKNGKILAGDMGIGTNGTLEDVTLNLIDMQIESAGHGMYLAANGSASIVDSEISGDIVGIELRAGSLYVSGDSKVSGGKGQPSVQPNGSGTTASNVALAVVQHTTKHPIKVVIEQGTFEGGAALLQADPQGNDTDNVSLEVKDGTYLGAIVSEDCTGFIQGGTFSDEGAADYLAEGSVLVKDENGMFGVQEEEPVVPPAPGPGEDEGEGQGEGGDQGEGQGDSAGDESQGGNAGKPGLPATGDAAGIAMVLLAGIAAAAIAIVGFSCARVRSE